MAITHHYAQVNGIRTHYLRAGQGPQVVLLLHGGGLDDAALSWGLLMPELAALGDGGRFTVLAPDWPGFGESGSLPEGISVAGLRDFLAAFLDQLGIASAALAGISMGGGAALGYALDHPGRVEKLILVDSYGFQRAAPMHRLSYLFIRTPGVRQLTWAMLRSRRMVRYSLEALLKRPGSVTEELVDQIYAQLTRPGAAQAFSQFQDSEITWEGIRTCYIDRLGELDIPVLIIHGTRDGLVPAAAVREAHAAIPGSRLVWLEGSGHWPQRDDPQGFNRAVLDFLR